MIFPCVHSNRRREPQVANAAPAFISQLSFNVSASSFSSIIRITEAKLAKRTLLPADLCSCYLPNMVDFSDYLKTQGTQGFEHLCYWCISRKLCHTITSATKVSLISFASMTPLPKVSHVKPHTKKGCLSTPIR